MAVTRKADVVNQIPQVWSTKLLAQAENATFFYRFEGPEGSSMPVIRKDDLEKEAGDTIKWDLVMALTGAGLTGGTVNGLLDGNEEKMKFRQQTFVVDALRHGVRWEKLGKVLITHDMRNTALVQIKKWLAGKLDNAVFAELTSGAQSSTTIPAVNKFFAGTASSVGTVTAAMLPTLNEISELKAYAQHDLKIEPIRMENDQEYFILVLDTYAALALKEDSQYQQAKRDAEPRAADNPLFTGALGMWDGVIFFSSNRTVSAADGAAGATVGRNLFLGAQAVARGYAYYPDWNEQYFSYGEEQGIGTFLVKGEKVNIFDLSSAGDGSGNQCLGHVVYYTGEKTPTPAS